MVEFVVIVLSCTCRLVSPRKVFQQNMQEKQHKAYHWWYQRTGTKGLTFTAPDHVTASLINIPTKDAQYCTTSTQTVVTLPKMVHTGINCDLKKCDDKGTQVAPTMCSIATQTNRPTLTIEDVQENHKTLKHLTAIPSKECFMAIFSELSEDEEHLEAEVGKRKEGFEILALPQKQNQKKGRKGTEK